MNKMRRETAGHLTPEAINAEQIPGMEKRRYLTELPEAIAPGLMLVHNHFRPARLGSPGFRAWLQEPGNNLLGCDCGWAPELGWHYTVMNRS
jgi:hypothetical protein